MVLCGGLEFVAAGVVYHEYQKHKKEKQRQDEEREEAIERQRRHRHRRHSTSSEKPRPRPSKQHEDYKYGYRPQHSSKPGLYDPGSRPAAIAGLYGATVPSSQYGSAVYGKPGAGMSGSASTLTVNTPPMRPTSAPTTDHAYQGQPPRQSSNSPPTYMMTQNPTYNSGLGPISHPPNQQQTSPYSAPLPPAGTDPRLHHTSSISSGPYFYQDTKHNYNPSLDPRRTSDTSLPLGIYEPSHASEARDSVHELGGGEYWMRDDYRYRHPTGGRYSHDPQHVRFRLPNDRVVGSGDRASVVETPPPAYRA